MFAAADYLIDMFALNQHFFYQSGGRRGSHVLTEQQAQDYLVSTLKEMIELPATMICLLSPWRDPVPFRRVW